MEINTPSQGLEGSWHMAFIPEKEMLVFLCYGKISTMLIVKLCITLSIYQVAHRIITEPITFVSVL